MLRKLLITAGLLMVGLLSGVDQAAAQLSPPPGGVKRTVLQKTDVPGTNYEVIQVMAEIPAKTAAGRHTHPGPEASVVVEGDMILKIDGQPDKQLKPGDAFQIATGVVHDVLTGDKPVKVIVAYTVEKGKPLATPAPAK